MADYGAIDWAAAFAAYGLVYQRPMNQGTAQNPIYPWSLWPGYKYDEVHIPTEPLPDPAPSKCECGSGCSDRSGAHSHWCPCWVGP